MGGGQGSFLPCFVFFFFVCFLFLARCKSIRSALWLFSWREPLAVLSVASSLQGAGSPKRFYRKYSPWDMGCVVALSGGRLRGQVGDCGTAAGFFCMWFVFYMLCGNVELVALCPPSLFLFQMSQLECGQQTIVYFLGCTLFFYVLCARFFSCF